jgi:pilus assembly protein Flp/PilA
MFFNRTTVFPLERSLRMKALRSLFRSLKEEESGQGMVEYVLIIALIAVAVIAFLPGVATAINNVLTNITGRLTGV